MSYLVITVGGSEGFEVLAPDDALEISPGGPDAGPNIVVIGSWAYLVGNQPSVQTPIAALGSDATKVAVQHIPPSTGNNGRIRFILLAGGPSHVTKLDKTDPHTMDNPPQYIDAWRDSSGNLDHIDDAAEFEPGSTPGSEQLIETIETVCEENGVEPP